MRQVWTLILDAGYGPKTPEAIRSENDRLKTLLARFCRGPYDESGVEFDIGLIVEGEIGNPNPRSGTKVGPFADNTIFAEIYVAKSDWNVPRDSYLAFLWFNVRRAILACVERLYKRKIYCDVDTLCKHLSIVEENFLGPSAKSVNAGTKSQVDPISLDELVEERPQRVVIQYQRDDENDPWNFDRKVSLENLLNDSLRPSNLGFCDCIDFGFATIDAICPVSNAREATRAIIETLRANGRLEGAVIEETANEKQTVVWPEGLVGGIEHL